MTTTDTTTQPIVDVPHVPPPVSDARLARLAEIADALHAAKLGGSWGWFGDVTCAGAGAYLATVHGGRRYLTGTMTKHEHWRVNDDRDDSWRVPSSCEGGDGCPLPTADDAKPGRAYRVDKPVPAFAVVGDKGWTVLRPGHEIPVFEVCRDATSEDDPRVYRTEVRGFRSPVAEWLAEADATTVRSLIDEVTQARAMASAVAALLEDVTVCVRDIDPASDLRRRLDAWIADPVATAAEERAEAVAHASAMASLLQDDDDTPDGAA